MPPCDKTYLLQCAIISPVKAIMQQWKCGTWWNSEVKSMWFRYNEWKDLRSPHVLIHSLQWSLIYRQHISHVTQNVCWIRWWLLPCEHFNAVFKLVIAYPHTHINTPTHTYFKEHPHTPAETYTNRHTHTHTVLKHTRQPSDKQTRSTHKDTCWESATFYVVL